MVQLVRNRINDSRTLRFLMLIVYDIVAVEMSAFLSLYLRFDFKFDRIRPEYLKQAVVFLPVSIVLTLGIYGGFRLYSSIWKYASVRELVLIVVANVIIAIIQFGGMELIGFHMPRSYYLLYCNFGIMFAVAGRFMYRLLRSLKIAFFSSRVAETTRTMVIGAGSAGRILIHEAKESDKVQLKICCVIDDARSKWGSMIEGVPIVGGRNKIVEMVHKYEIEQIILAMPSVPMCKQQEILHICQETDCELKILPGVYQFINSEISVSKLRNVEIEDLLGRDPISVNLDSVLNYVQGQVVLVTGGGGSIGSEICRQIAAHDPKELIVLDIYENTTYDLQQELKKNFPMCKLTVLIGSVRNTHRVNNIFETYKPDIVFHAAAHKHVPLMEASPNEAIKNNVFGTLNCAKAANANGTKRFVLISTDKAVNPTNIMGATKRICEMIIQGMAKTTTGTEFVAVRFGNVLGSNGSVIPLFKKQIAEGGPVTVTDKNIIRYFMTIPEAVSLVLQAGAYAKGGEIFVLDMGEPVKIDDLARNLIKLSGYKPDEDIAIVYTGLRPGEKLYEELLMAEEGLTETENKLIHIGKPLEFDEKKFFEDLILLKEKAYEDGSEGRKMVQKMVPTYKETTQ